MAGYYPVTIAITDDGFVRTVVSRSADRFKQLNGARPRIMTSPPKGAPAGIHPAYYKAWLWDVVPDDVDRIMFIDYDMVPVKALGDLPDCAFAAVQAHASLQPAMDVYPFFRKSKIYFNTGLFLAHRSTRPIFEQLKAFASAHPTLLNQRDQPIFNMIVQQHVDVTLLPDELNYQITAGPKHVPDPKMVHVNAIGDQRWNVMALLLSVLEGNSGSAADHQE